MSETRRWKNVLCLLAGCLVTYLIFMSKLRSGGEGDLRLRGELQTAQANLQAAQADLRAITQQRDACNGKFARSTILYDTGLFGETRAWVIPADIEPVVVGQKRGSYSHYDSKTQTETLHLQPKAQ